MSVTRRLRRVWPYASTAAALVLWMLLADERRVSSWYKTRADKTAEAEQKALRYRQALQQAAAHLDKGADREAVRVAILNALTDQEAADV